ncbi:hypothetical protein N0V86_007410 [Didymella sp. IMI 355093]|nr:hypothetical protein N0V86_007410 [Didymella sp. IMI 355093]
MAYYRDKYTWSIVPSSTLESLDTSDEQAVSDIFRKPDYGLLSGLKKYLKATRSTPLRERADDLIEVVLRTYGPSTHVYCLMIENKRETEHKTEEVRRKRRELAEKTRAKMTAGDRQRITARLKATKEEHAANGTEAEEAEFREKRRARDRDYVRRRKANMTETEMADPLCTYPQLVFLPPSAKPKMVSFCQQTIIKGRAKLDSIDSQYLVGTRLRGPRVEWGFPTGVERGTPGAVVLIGQHILKLLNQQAEGAYHDDEQIHSLLGVIGLMEVEEINEVTTGHKDE